MKPYRNCQRFIFLIGCLLVWMAGSVDWAEARSFFEFKGQRSAWYFNLMDGRAAIGLKGPFATEGACRTQTEAFPNSDVCYERETVAFYKWRQNTVKTWVLPLQTGELSEHLIFTGRPECHRVAMEGFYYSSDGLEIPLLPDLRTCVVGDVPFNEFEQRYAWISKHAVTQEAYPKRYKAWSMVVDQGKYRKILQFPYQQHCQQVAEEGRYYSFIPRMGFGNMRVTYDIPKNLRFCEKRAPQLHEVPVVYLHIEAHKALRSSQKNQSISSEKGKPAWVLTMKKEGGPFSLYFEKRRDCVRVLQQKVYFREISRGGIFPSKVLRFPIETILQKCVQTIFSDGIQQQFYPFSSRH